MSRRSKRVHYRRHSGNRWRVVLGSALFGLAVGAAVAIVATNRSEENTRSVPTSTSDSGGAADSLGTSLPATALPTSTSGPPTSPAPTTASTIPPSTFPPNDLTLVRYDMATVQLDVTTVAGIPQADDALGDRITHFDDSGNGTLLTVDVATGDVALTSPTGATDNWRIPATDLGGSIHDAAIGPDRLLYVSRTPLDPLGQPTTFTLVAYDLSSLAPEELRRWDTNWQCVEVFCGEIMFSERLVGPPYGTNVRYAGSVIDPALAPPQRQPITPLTPPSECATESAGFFGPLRDVVTYETSTWELEAVCSSTIEGAWATYLPQADGSVIALTSVAGEPDGELREFLVWLQPDGSRETFDVSDLGVVDATTDAGRVLVATKASGENIGLLTVSPAR